MRVTDPIRAFLSVPEPRNPQVSSDGEWVAAQWNPTGRYELHLAHSNTGELRQITDGELPSDPPWWTNWWVDRRTMIFQEHANAPGREEYPESTRIYQTNLEGSVSSLFVIPSGSKLWGVHQDEGLIYYRHSGEGNWYDSTASTHGTFTPVTGDVTGQVLPGPHGRVGFNVLVQNESGSGVAVCVADARGEDSKELLVPQKAGEQYSLRGWHPDGDSMLINHRVPGSPPQCGLYSIEQDEISWITNSLATSLLEGGEHVLCGTTLQVYRINGSRIQPRSEGRMTTRHFWGPASVLDDHRCVVRQQAVRKPPELVMYDINSEERNVLFAPSYEQVSIEALVPGTEVRDVSFEGETISGVIYHPPGLTSGSAPMVADLYGHRGYVDKNYQAHHQALAHFGYFVFVPACDQPSYSEDEHAHFATVGKWLSSHDQIDTSQVICYGHSHGGYDVYIQAVKYPNVWDGFIANTGYVDLSDPPSSARNMLGDPEENADKYRKLSPIELVDETVGRPLMMIHGEEDKAADHPIAFADCLEGLGLDDGDDFEVVILSGHEHNPKDVEKQIEQWEEILEFLEKIRHS